jgi:hypothetical protein
MTGRKRAMAKGIKFGREPKLTAHQRQEAIARREAGETAVTSLTPDDPAAVPEPFRAKRRGVRAKPESAQ